MSKHGSGTYDQFIIYRGVIMRAIALAWRDKDFAARLAENPKAALKKEFDYTFPFNVDLEVQNATATWEPKTVADWKVNTENILQMVLPPAPKDPKERVEALADYNAKHLTFLQD